MKKILNEDIKNKSGIYQIKNLINGNCYIGSTICFIARFTSHKSKLKGGYHDNDYLQKSFNKYGHNSFEFSVLEVVQSCFLIEREQFFLDYLLSQGIKCYNLSFNVERYQLNNDKKKNYELVDPFGKLCIFKNCFIKEIARQILENVEFSKKCAGLYSVISGKSKSYKGWRLKENQDYDYKNWRKIRKVKYKHKTYDIKLLSPTGEVFGPIYNLNNFCKEHNIKNISDIINLIKGRTRYINGWSIFKGEYKHPLTRSAKIFDIKLQSPDGKIFGPIENLTKFCRDQKINVSSIRDLINGKKKTNNYKGWKLL